MRDPKLYKPKTQSRGDIQAYGTFYKKAGERMGTWTLILRRKLDTGHPEDDIILKDGEVYPIAFAVFDFIQKHFLDILLRSIHQRETYFSTYRFFAIQGFLA